MTRYVGGMNSADTTGAEPAEADHDRVFGYLPDQSYGKQGNDHNLAHPGAPPWRTAQRDRLREQPPLCRIAAARVSQNRKGRKT
jgi:hypothetical protein